MRTSLASLTNALTAALLVFVFPACSDETKKSRFGESAKKYFDAGEYEKAKIEYLNVLKLDASDAEAIGRLGLIWMEQGAPVRAIPYLLESRRVKPGNIPPRISLLKALMSVGAVKEAREEAAAILKAAPDNGEALVLLADAARSPEDIDRARQEISRFPRPNSAAAHLAAAFLSLRGDDAAAAEAAVAKALAAEPGSAPALIFSAILRLKENDVAGADLKLKTAADLVPARSPHRLKYAEFKAQQKDPDAQAQARAMAEDIIRQAPDCLPALTFSAQLDLGAGKSDEAMATLDKVFAVDQSYLPARLLQAKGLMAKGEAARAVAVLEKLLEAHPDQFMVKFQLALASVQSANPSRAIGLLKDVLKDQPGFADAILLLAELNLRNGEPAAVIPAVSAILKERPAHPLANHLLASAHQALGRPEEAVKVMEALIKAAPPDARNHFRLGELLLAAGKIDLSRSAFEKALEMTPGSFTAAAKLVELDLIQKNFPSAMDRVNGLLQKSPDSARTHFLKARVHAAQKALSEAEAELLKAIELDAAYADAYDLLAAIYVDSGKLPAAVGKLEALLAKTPDNMGALRQLALLYDRQREYAKASAAYDKLLALLPAPEAMVLNNQAYLLLEHLNQPDKAYELARKARGLRPGAESSTDPNVKAETAAIADTLGWTHFRRGEYQEALALAREAGGHLTENPEVQFHVGMAAYMMGQQEVARTALKKAVASGAEFPGKQEAQSRLALLGAGDGAASSLTIGEIEALLKKQPNDIILLTRLAEACQHEREFAKAATAWEQALKQNPKLANVAANLARLYAGPLQDMDHAMEKGHKLAVKARETLPDDPELAQTLAILSYHRKDHAYAVQLLEESARKKPLDSQGLYYEGMARFETKDTAGSKAALTSAIAAGLPGKLAAEAKRVLAELDRK